MDHTEPLPMDIQEPLQERLGRAKNNLHMVRQLASLVISNFYELEDVETYHASTWSLDDLHEHNRSEPLTTSSGVTQVFRHWHRLSAIDYELTPIAYFEAKHSDYPLDLLGAFVVCKAIPGPVSREFLQNYHTARVSQLIN